MRGERNWMYERRDGKVLSEKFVTGVQEFIDFACQQQSFADFPKLRCPCSKSKNMRYAEVEDVRLHLYRHGFKENYFKWVCHGESFDDVDPQANVSRSFTVETNTYQDMVVDVLGPLGDDTDVDGILQVEVEPNPKAKGLFEMLRAAEKPMCEGSRVSILEMATRIINLKCEFNIAHRCVDGFASLLKDVITNENLMTATFYETKKLLQGLELSHQKIHCCRNGCILFWKNDANLDKCWKCNEERYRETSNGNLVPVAVLTYFPITPRLQRLYATRSIAEEMRWHFDNPRVSGKMSHPRDGEAWKSFDDTYPDFASEGRNVRLGLVTDGFAPFGESGFGRR